MNYWISLWIVVVALMAGLVYGAYRWRVRSIEARNRELVAEVAGKTRQIEIEVARRLETEARLRKTRDELTTMMAVSQELVSTLELNALLVLILDQLRHVLEYDFAAVLTLEDDDLVFRAHQGLPLGFDETSLVLPTARIAPLRRAVFERRPFTVDDVHMEPWLSLEFGEATGFDILALFGEGHSWMGVPITIGDTMIGLLGFLHCEPGFYQADHLAVAQVFANQAAIAIQNAQLYEEAQTAAAAAERNRIARDLHDSVTQTLFSASVIAETMPDIWAKNRDDAWRNLEKLRLMTRGALAEMRTLLFELRPDALTQVPLTRLLVTLADASLGRSRVPVTLNIEGECTVPTDVKIGLYRIVQEALSNVAKHAEATETTVTLSCAADQIAITVRDNGNGFDPKAVSPGHFGLSIMVERAARFGASLSIASSPGSGTEVAVMWPETTEQADD